MIEERSKTIILCSILKKECKDHLVNQQMIADKIGKSKQYVSFVMNGVQPVTHIFMEGVLSLCKKNIRFNYNEHYQERIAELLDDYLSEYCYYSDDYYLKKMQEYLSEEMYFSYACPEYLAMQCALSYQTNKIQELEFLIETTDKHFREMMTQSKKALLLYLLIKSEWQIDNNNFSSALKTLKEAKEQASSSCILGVIDLLKGIAEIHLSNYLQALEHFQNAEKLLLEARAYGRALAVAKNIGSCYAYLLFYDKAEKQFKKTAKEAKRLNRHDLESICYLSLCNVLFRQGRFQESIEYGKKVKSNDDLIHYISMAWSYYFLEDYDSCRKYQNRLTKSDDIYLNMMVELLDMYLNKVDTDKKIAQLTNMIEYSEMNECQNDVVWCVKFLINEYRNQGDYKKVAYYQEIILNSLGYRSFFKD